MLIYLISDEYRVDGITGRFIEEAFDADLPMYDREILLRSARNQYVSFQVVLDAREEGRIGNADITFTRLSSPEGELSDDYEVFIEWFHTIDGQHIPDMLIPYKKNQVELRVPQSEKYIPDQKVGAFWVDLFVPKEAKPGVYRGQMAVTTDGHKKTFTICVKVYAATVPSESLMIADLNNYADSISPCYPKLRDNPDRYRDGSYLQIERQFYRMAREHRCLFENLNAPHSGNPPDTFAPELTGSGKNMRIASWETYDQHYGPYLDGSAFKGSRRGEMPIEFLFTPFNLGWPAKWSKWGKTGYTTEYQRILWQYMTHFEEKGWINTKLVTMLNNKKEYRFFPTTQDEIWYLHDEEITRKYFEVIGNTMKHSTAQMIFRADESNNYHNHYHNDIGEKTDLWVANMTMFSWFPEAVQWIKNRKSILWHYGWYGEGFTLDLPLTALFSMPMLGFMTGTTGFCFFWNSVGFGLDPLDAPFVDGGQAMFYPGTDIPGADDVLPCIRLKAMRNFMQLTDLMMLSNGTRIQAWPPVQANLEDIVNRHFRYTDKSAWWRETPPFIHEEPRYWDNYIKDFSELTNVHYKHISPRVFGEIQKDVLRVMSDISLDL